MRFPTFLCKTISQKAYSRITINKTKVMKQNISLLWLEMRKNEIYRIKIKFIEHGI